MRKLGIGILAIGLLVVLGAMFARRLALFVDNSDHQPQVMRSIQPQPQPRPEDAQAVQADGWRLWQQGRFDEAIAKFQRAVELGPNNANAWYMLGSVDLESGRVPEAEKAFQQTLRIPDAHDAWNQVGQLYLSRGEYAKAESWLLKAAPNAPAAWFGLARLYLLRGQYDKAEKWAQQAVDADPSNQDTRRLLDAAKEKHLSHGLRRLIEPRPAGSAAADH